MAKRSGSNLFRTVDVDQYNEDNFQDDVIEESYFQEINEAELNNLLAQSKNIEALKLVLTNPPVTIKNQAVKDIVFQQVMKVLLSFKTINIEAAVNSLDVNSVDYLMKYIYRGFEKPPENNALLLTWHDKAFARGNVGSIIRVLTDRKHV